METLKTTRNHPLYVDGRGFVPAGGLAIGNAIVTRAGPRLIVASIKWHRSAAGFPVYNFEVANNHNYFVGKSGVWVHNGEGCEKHHLFPKAFKDYFKDIGIKINKYTITIDRDLHRSLHAGSFAGGDWNELWDSFLKSKPGKEACEEFMQYMLEGFDLKNYNIQSYWKR